MSAKAVFASQTLAIYINGYDLDVLLECGGVDADLWYGKVPVTDDIVVVSLSEGAIASIESWLAVERQLIADIGKKTGKPPKGTRIDPTEKE